MDYEMSFLRLMTFCSPHVGLANVWDDWKNAIVVKAAKLFTSEFKKISSLQSSEKKLFQVENEKNIKLEASKVARKYFEFLLIMQST